MKKRVLNALVYSGLLSTMTCGCNKSEDKVIRLTYEMNKDTIEVLSADSNLVLDISNLGEIDFVHIMNKSDHAYEFYQIGSDGIISLNSKNVEEYNAGKSFFLRKNDLYLMLLGSKVVEGNDTVLDVRLKNFVKPI